MKCSLGISNFLEEISSLSHSVVFLYFFALVAEDGFLIFPCYSLELCIQMGISFLFSFALGRDVDLNYCDVNDLPCKRTEIIMFLRLRPSTAFLTLVDYEGYSISLWDSSLQ